MPVIHQKWTKKYGFRYFFVWKGKSSGRFPTLEDAEAGLRAKQRLESEKTTGLKKRV